MTIDEQTHFVHTASKGGRCVREALTFACRTNIELELALTLIREWKRRGEPL